MPHPRHLKPTTLKDFLPEGLTSSSNSDEESEKNQTSEPQGGQDQSNDMREGAAGGGSGGSNTAPAADTKGPLLYLQKVRSALRPTNPFGPFPQSKEPLSAACTNPSATAPGSKLSASDTEKHAADQDKNRGGGVT
ncbi:hypothetical protein [Neorickettsia sennetsu]|uniref:Uncharacterized protein n=1 Tax=Ehrlichia sennetsu (strain ATCC VR-367 / Miyayama) TaxID=222891 RepID=Q2GDB2_EHRS3|nr:hypothetical protein [Neorickettsia sennetsu]ABD46223.1 hypothetical protein NSE_0656 [Neorickettsia sennetsu str. Miyayama]